MTDIDRQALEHYLTEPPEEGLPTGEIPDDAFDDDFFSSDDEEDEEFEDEDVVTEEEEE